MVHARASRSAFPTESYAAIGKGMMPVIIFIVAGDPVPAAPALHRYGKHTYAIGSNEQAARVSGINVEPPHGARLRDRGHARRGSPASCSRARPDRARPAWA